MKNITEEYEFESIVKFLIKELIRNVKRRNKLK